MRFSLRHLLGGCAFCAIGCAALRYASAAWAAAMLAMAVGLLCWSALQTVCGPGAGRPFWAGFLAAGAIALGLLTWPGTPERLRARLPTTRCFGRLYPRVHRQLRSHAIVPRATFDESFSAWAFAHPLAQDVRLEIGDQDAIVSWTVSQAAPFERIGHVLLAMLLAFLGGACAAGVAAAWRRTRALRAETQNARRPSTAGGGE